MGRISVAAVGLIALAPGCSEAPTQVTVDNAWVRLGATPRIPAAAYFTIHGGPTDATLINVSTDVAIKSEMHESMTSGPATAMRPVVRMAIPARATVAFKPGGRHVMLFFMNPGIHPGRPITLSLAFADGHRIRVSARTVGPGDPPPQPE